MGSVITVVLLQGKFVRNQVLLCKWVRLYAVFKGASLTLITSKLIQLRILHWKISRRMEEFGRIAENGVEDTKKKKCFM